MLQSNKCFENGLEWVLRIYLIEISFDKKKKIIVGLIYRHPCIPINDFCDNFSIECLKKYLFLIMLAY